MLLISCQLLHNCTKTHLKTACNTFIADWPRNEVSHLWTRSSLATQSSETPLFLRSRCGHYVFVLWFLFLSVFFFLAYSQPIGCSPYFHTWSGLSAYLGCRPKTCCTWLTENTGRKKSPKIRYLRTIAQLCRTISSQLRHVSTIGKSC